MPETGTLVAIAIVIAVLLGVAYITTRPNPNQSPMLEAGGGGGNVPEGAAYITAVGGAIGSTLGGIFGSGGVAGLVSRQAGGSAIGGK